MILLRFLARLVAFVLLVALALAGVAVAVFCIQGGDGALSPAGLANLVRLPDLRDEVRRLLATVEADGSVAVLTALSGAGAVLAGLMLIVGATAPRRERLVTVSNGRDGSPTARRRALASVAGALAEQARGVSRTKVRVSSRRRRPGGVVKLKVSHTRRSDRAEVRRQVERELAELSDGFSLKVRVQVKPADGAGRVQ